MPHSRVHKSARSLKMVFSQFLRKKVNFIPVAPVQFPPVDVFEFPTDTPEKTEIVKAKMSELKKSVPVVRKVSPRNLTGNVRDIKNIVKEEDPVIRKSRTEEEPLPKKPEVTSTNFIVEPKPIEKGRPRREVTLITRANSSGSKIMKLPETKNAKITGASKTTKLYETKNAKIPETTKTKIPETKENTNIIRVTRSNSKLTEAKDTRLPGINKPTKLRETTLRLKTTATTNIPEAKENKSHLTKPSKLTKTPKMNNLLETPEVITPNDTKTTKAAVTKLSDTKSNVTDIKPSNIMLTGTNPAELVSATPVKRSSGRKISGSQSVFESRPTSPSSLQVKPMKVKRSRSISKIKTKRAVAVTEKNDTEYEFSIEVSDESDKESFEGVDSDFEDVEFEPFAKRTKRSKSSKLEIKSKSSNSARWDRIKQVLKSGETIEALPGRIDEFDWIKRTVLGLLESALGGCLYISGVPGTGKTATTHRTLDALSLSALKGKCPDFDFVEINGMRLSDPGQAYSILARSIFKKKVPTNGALALKMLEAHFKDQQKTKKAGRPCVVLLDELDLLLRKRQSLLYHFFEWPNWTNSQLIVITIANTMDLPERFLSNRISSRLGLTRYNFKPYDHAALSNIIEHQLKDYVKYLGKDAIQLCARKVSAVSGDARRAVNLAKRAVDYFRSATQEELQARITGRQVTEKVPEASQLSAVNLRLMDIILKEALMANPVEVIGKLSKHQRIMLLSVILSRKRAEEEISIRGGTKIIGKSGNNNNINVILTVNRVLEQHFQLCRTHQYHPLPSLQELYILLESLESLRLLRCLKFRESGPESVIQLLVHEEDIRKGLGDDQSLKKYIRE